MNFLLKRVAGLSLHAPSRRLPLSAMATRRFTSTWAHVKQGPPDPILGVAEAFRASKSPAKVNLGIGAYRDDDGKPVVLPCVQEAERRVLAKDGYNHEYAPIGGLPELAPLVQRLALGEGAKDLNRIVTMQALSGTGALCVLTKFVKTHWNTPDALPKIWMPAPTWGAHPLVFAASGLKSDSYTYYDSKTCGLDFEGLKSSLAKIPANDMIMFHATAHNPTGVDPTPAQWDEVCEMVAAKGNLVLFDMAYQGFASGDCEKDAYGLRRFYEAGVPLMLAQSFAKNFGLYGQRAGAASIVCSNAAEAKRVESQLKRVCRATWSNPPLHGGRIVLEILSDAELKQQWLADVKGMAQRIIEMRTLLRGHLETATGTQWPHVTEQIGMFCFTGMNETQSVALTDKHQIYLTKNGRISMAGVNSHNVEYIAKSIADVVSST